MADRGGDALEHVGPDWKLLHRHLVGVEDHHVELSPLHLARLDLVHVPALDRSRKLVRVGPKGGFGVNRLLFEKQKQIKAGVKWSLVGDEVARSTVPSLSVTIVGLCVLAADSAQDG